MSSKHGIGISIYQCSTRDILSLDADSISVVYFPCEQLTKQLCILYKYMPTPPHVNISLKGHNSVPRRTIFDQM